MASNRSRSAGLSCSTAALTRERGVVAAGHGPGQHGAAPALAQLSTVARTIGTSRSRGTPAEGGETLGPVLRG